VADTTDSTSQQGSGQSMNPGFVSRAGRIALGAYLVLFTFGVAAALWRVVPACDVAGLIATRLSPSQALTEGGEQLLVSGEGFRPGATVQIGDAPPVQAAVISPLELTVTTPKHAAGRVRVVVAQGTFAPVEIPDGLQYVDARPASPAPTNAAPPPAIGKEGAPPAPPTQATPLLISAIAPESASVVGGDAVTITGAGFTANTTVRFGGLRARSVSVDGSRFITAVTPMHPVGAVSVLVANDQNISSLDGRFNFVCPAAPDRTMVLLVLLAGALGGLVHGLRSFYWYVGEQKLLWNWVPMYVVLPFSSASLGFVFYLVIRAGLFQPTAGTSYLLIGVAALVGMFSAQAAEKLKDIAEGLFAKVQGGSNQAPPASSPATVAVPAITTIKPASGPLVGGTVVTIAGTGFGPQSAVRFGHTPSPQVTLVNTTTLKAVAPSHPNPEAVDMGVTVPGKPEIVKAAAFTYAAPKGKITKVDPKEGAAAGGTAVTVTGEQFTQNVSVLFGEEPAASIKFVDATTLNVTTPRQAQSGAVDVRVDAGVDLIAVAPRGFEYKP
jgi:IPT/TIG domain-containing protein